jgi:hypothetical protein
LGGLMDFSMMVFWVLVAMYILGLAVLLVFEVLMVIDG